MQDITTLNDAVNSDSHLVTTPAGITFNPQTDEEWAPMYGYPWNERFEVSNYGRRRYRADYDGRRYPIKEWGALDTYGYQIFSLRIGEEQYRYKAHRAVWEAFNGPLEEGTVVRHWADNPLDNRLSELSIGTPRDNSHDWLRNKGNLSANHCEVGHLKLGQNLIAASLKRGKSHCRACNNAICWARSRRERKGVEVTDAEIQAYSTAKYEQYGGEELDAQMEAYFEANGCYPPAFTVEELRASAGLLPTALQPAQGELDLVG